MEIINKSLIDVEKGVIIHQVNNKKVMGAGIALEIRNKYPQHYNDFMNMVPVLGNIVCTKINPGFGVIGIYGQNGYGRDRRYTDYNAVASGLQKIAELHDKNPKVKYYIPVGMGCSLAGGNWKIVSGLIEKYAPFVILCNYK